MQSATNLSRKVGAARLIACFLGAALFFSLSLKPLVDRSLNTKLAIMNCAHVLGSLYMCSEPLKPSTSSSIR